MADKKSSQYKSKSVRLRKKGRGKRKDKGLRSLKGILKRVGEFDDDEIESVKIRYKEEL